jgi:hypothetical protein
MQSNGLPDGFIPFIKNEVEKLPYFSDARLDKHGIRGQGTERSIAKLETMIREIVGKLGASVVGFSYGKYAERPIRYGVIVHYIFGIQHGQFELKTLPVKSDAKSYRDGAIKQALFNLHLALEGSFNMRLLNPDFSAAMLIGHLLVPGRGKTFVKVLQENNEIPSLKQPGESILKITDGEIMD